MWIAGGYSLCCVVQCCVVAVAAVVRRVCGHGCGLYRTTCTWRAVVWLVFGEAHSFLMARLFALGSCLFFFVCVCGVLGAGRWKPSGFGFQPLLEVGAGTGFWASLLRKRGCEVEAVDVAPPGDKHNEYHGRLPPFTAVRRSSAAHATYPHAATLFLCYPPPHSTCALQALDLFKGGGGEGWWGSCGVHSVYAVVVWWWCSFCSTGSVCGACG